MSNAVEAAHAAYSLEDEEVWLERLADIIAPDLDRGRGIVAFRWKYQDSAVVPQYLTTRGGLAGDADMLRELLANLDARRAYLAYGAPYAYRTLSEIATDHPTIEDLRDDSDMQELAHDRKVVDFEMLRVDISQGRGWMFSVLLDEIDSIAPPRRGVWQKVGAHIAAGARLRARLGDRGIEGAAVTFDQVTGTLEVQSSVFESTERRERLRELIAAREATTQAESDKALDLWQALIDGRWSLLDTVDSDGRAFTVLHENPLSVRSRLALSERERQVAYLVARGHHVKLVAYELGIAASTVRSHLHSAMRKLNVADRSTLCRLVANVRAPGDVAEVAEVGLLALVESVSEMPEILTDAESDVARLIFEGLTNEEIAARRETSERTIANQIAAVYRKLGVNSRIELVEQLC